MKKNIFAALLFMFALALSADSAYAQRGQPPITDDNVTQLDDMVVEANREDGVAGNDTVQQIVTNYIVKASNYGVYFLVALTVLVFMYGLMVYMFKGRESDAARTEGRKLMLWGIIGIFVMISVWGIVKIVSSTFGHTSTAIPQFKDDVVSNQPQNNPVLGDTENRQTERQERRQGIFRRLMNGGQNLLNNGRQNVNSLLNSLRNAFNRNNPQE